MKKLSIYELLVLQYNRLYNLYYKVRFERNLSRLQYYLSVIKIEYNRYLELLSTAERGHLFLRKIPSKYLTKLKSRTFEPLGYVIPDNIDVDMFLAMIYKMITLIENYINLRIARKEKWVKVVFVIAGASRSGKYGRGPMRHIEAHMVCTVPSTMVSVDSNGAVHFKDPAIEDIGFNILSYFLNNSDFDFLLTFFNLHRGIAFMSNVNKPSNYVRFYVYDFNYPGRRREAPLVKFFDIPNDVGLPGVKVYSYAHTPTGRWWTDINYDEIVENIMYFY